MKRTSIRAGNVITVCGVIAAVLLSAGCTKMSESVLDESTGMNGGFEVTESGLPVNWLVYTPRTVPTGDFDVVIDTAEYRSGRQSLKFVGSSPI